MAEIRPAATFGTVTFQRSRPDRRRLVRHAYRSVLGIMQTLCGRDVEDNGRWHSRREGLVPSDRALISCEMCRSRVNAQLAERQG
jgi:hypothetical protein